MSKKPTRDDCIAYLTEERMARQNLILKYLEILDSQYQKGIEKIQNTAVNERDRNTKTLLNTLYYNKQENILEGTKVLDAINQQVFLDQDYLNHLESKMLYYLKGELFYALGKS
jgi:hypothetical protein